MKQTTPFSLLSTLCACLAAQMQVHAQHAQVQVPMQPPTHDSSTLPTVTIRAQEEGATTPAYAGGQLASEGHIGILGQQHFLETPFSTTAYTDAYIQNQQAQEMGSLFRGDPAVHVPSKRNQVESIMVRGFSFRPDDIFFNGLAGMAPVNRMVPEMVERVEILKGPSAFLTGMPPLGSIGASVQMQPKRAGQRPVRRLTSSYESDGLWGGHVDVGQRFGTENQWGLRFNGVYRDGDTTVKNQKHQTSMGALALDWRNTHMRLSADIYNQYEHMQGVDYVGIYAIAPRVTRLPAARRGDYAQAAPWAFMKQNSHAALLRAEWDIAEHTTAWLAGGNKKSYYSNLTTFNMLMNDNAVIAARPSRIIRTAGDKALDIGLRGRMHTGNVRHHWSIAATRNSGYNHTRRQQYAGLNAHFGEHGIEYNGMPDIAGFDPSRDNLPVTGKNVLHSFAIANTLYFAQDTWQLTLGARRQTVKNDGFSSGTLASATRYNESRITPSIALLHRANDQLSIYGSYIEGLSQGGTAPNTAANAGEMLKPYQSKQYELGSKMDLGLWAWTASIFQIDKPGAQTDPVTQIYAEYGTQRHCGLELLLFGEPRSGLRLLGGISWLQAQWHKTITAGHLDKQITGVPKLMLKINAEVDLPAIPGLTLTGHIQHTGRRNATDDARLALPSSTTLDAGVRYALGQQLTLRATVQNLTNKAYWAGSRMGGDGSGLSGGLGAPRTVLISATVEF